MRILCLIVSAVAIQILRHYLRSGTKMGVAFLEPNRFVVVRIKASDLAEQSGSPLRENIVSSRCYAERLQVLYQSAYQAEIGLSIDATTPHVANESIERLISTKVSLQLLVEGSKNEIFRSRHEYQLKAYLGM